jgi:hypothetical protein
LDLVVPRLFGLSTGPSRQKILKRHLTYAK